MSVKYFQFVAVSSGDVILGMYDTDPQNQLIAIFQCPVAQAGDIVSWISSYVNNENPPPFSLESSGSTLTMEYDPDISTVTVGINDEGTDSIVLFESDYALMFFAIELSLTVAQTPSTDVAGEIRRRFRSALANT